MIDSERWTIGKVQRHYGSIHSDIWKGTAAEVAASNKLAIYPRRGWWKTRKHLNKENSVAHYSLIVSIETPKLDIDIYTPVVERIRLMSSITT